MKWDFGKVMSTNGHWTATATVTPKSMIDEPWDITLTAENRTELIGKIEAEMKAGVNDISGEIRHAGTCQSFTLFP